MSVSSPSYEKQPLFWSSVADDDDHVGSTTWLPRDLLLDGCDESSDRLQARWAMQPRQELRLAMWVVLDELERATEAPSELAHIIRVKDRVHIDYLIG